MTDRIQLVEQLIALEQQAAQVAALLDGADEELIAQTIAAFAPMPAGRGATRQQRDRWGVLWLAWLADCGDRYEARPLAHPAGEVMAELLLAWVRR
jgi:hypothetical protein